MDPDTERILKRQNERSRQLATERHGGGGGASPPAGEATKTAAPTSPPAKRLSSGGSSFGRADGAQLVSSPQQQHHGDENIRVSVADEPGEDVGGAPAPCAVASSPAPLTAARPPAMGMRSRWANLASHLDDFEDDCKSVPPSRRPKESFMRGPAPRMSKSDPSVAPGAALSSVSSNASTANASVSQADDAFGDRSESASNDTDTKTSSAAPASDSSAPTWAFASAAASAANVVDEVERAACDAMRSNDEDGGVRMRRKLDSAAAENRPSIADMKAMWEKRLSENPPQAAGSPAAAHMNRASGTVSFVGDAKAQSEADRCREHESSARAAKSMWLERTANEPSPAKTPQRVPAAPPLPKSFAAPVVAPSPQIQYGGRSPHGQRGTPAVAVVKSPAVDKPPAPAAAIVRRESGDSAPQRRSIVPGDPERRARIAKLRDRWEVATSVGRPMDPNSSVANDELLHAAAEMQRAHVRQLSAAALAEHKRQSPGIGPRKASVRSVTIKDSVEYIEPSDDGHVEPTEEDEEQGGDSGDRSPSAEPEELPYPADVPEPDAGADTVPLYPADEPDTSYMPDEQSVDELIDDVFQPIHGGSEECTPKRHNTSSSSRSLAMAHQAATSDSPVATTTDSSTSVDHQPQPTAPLVHSVSFYRREQQERASHASSTATPVHVRPAAAPSLALDSEHSGSTGSAGSIASAVDSNKLLHYIDMRLKKLNESVTIETKKIEQASKALVVAQSRAEFRDSREEVEAKRALLLAIESRRSLVEMVERYLSAKRERRLPAGEAAGPKGTLTMSNITVPLRRQFVNTHYNHGGDTLYYFVALVKHAEVLLHTELVTSDEALQRTNLEFPNMLTLHRLSHDFKLRVEFFYLKARRSAVPHEAKYGLGGTLKSRSTLSGMFSAVGGGGGPSHCTPVGPATVGDPSFQQCGHVELDIGSLGGGGKFSLHAAHSGPLDSQCVIKMRCFAESAGDVQMHGFLNVYEEVASVSSWQRYWCWLREGALHFWRFPDDAEAKPALATIDLSRCANDTVARLSGDQCTRAHSFRLDLVPDDGANDHRRKASKIILAADDRDAFAAWTDKINETFANLRMWRPSAAGRGK